MVTSGIYVYICIVICRQLLSWANPRLPSTFFFWWDEAGFLVMGFKESLKPVDERGLVQPLIFSLSWDVVRSRARCPQSCRSAPVPQLGRQLVCLACSKTTLQQWNTEAVSVYTLTGRVGCQLARGHNGEFNLSACIVI